MQFVTDLHLHSKYSRAVSPKMTLPVMAQYAQQKGINILSAADFTHPLWFKEVSLLLQEDQDGLYLLKTEVGSLVKTYFMLSTEIASIYKQGGKLRRIHNLVFAPSLEVVEKINTALIKRGCNLSADGRPIIGLTSRNLLELILEIDERCFLIPCHIWTPHFGLYGSASGFDSIEEAFGDLARYIYGIETGLSSDPDMNWSVRELRNRSILSFSDAHSAPKMGRESTVFELEGKTPTYSAIKDAVMKPSQVSVEKENGHANFQNRILYTIEFYPEEGKYHFSGHRNCKVAYGPSEIKDKGTVCPVCHKRLTEGVLVRVQQLTDDLLQNRAVSKQNSQGLLWHTDLQHEQPPYVKLVPLIEIVAESMHSTVASQKVIEMYMSLCAQFSSEIEILLKTAITDIQKVAGERIAQGIEKVRSGNIDIHPGYDGEYGKVTIWKEDITNIKNKNLDQSQLSLDI